MNAFDRLILLALVGTLIGLAAYAALFGEKQQPQPVYVNVNQSVTVDQNQTAPQYMALPTMPPMPTMAPPAPVAPQVLPIQPPVDPFNQPAAAPIGEPIGAPIGYLPPPKARPTEGALLYSQRAPGEWQKAGQP